MQGRVKNEEAGRTCMKNQSSLWQVKDFTLPLVVVYSPHPVTIYVRGHIKGCIVYTSFMSTLQLLQSGGSTETIGVTLTG